MKIQVKVEGITPLLMNKFNPDSLGENQIRPKSNKNESPREAAFKTAYMDKENILYVPSDWIFGSLINAGKFHKYGKNKITTLKSSLIPAAVNILEEYFSLNTSHFEVDSRAVVNPSTQGRIMKHRARLDVWQIIFTLEVDETMFDAKFIRTLVDDAGSKIGIGDYRPDRRGKFGKFKVIEWKVLNYEKIKL